MGCILYFGLLALSNSAPHRFLSSVRRSFRVPPSLGLVESSLLWSEPGLLFGEFSAKLSMADLVSEESIHKGFNPNLYGRQLIHNTTIVIEIQDSMSRVEDGHK
jgi:hypothetical protein